MKLSEMKYKDMMKVLSTITAEAEPILEDKEVMKIAASFFGPAENESDEDYRWRLSKQMFTCLSMVSGKYNQAFSRILAALFACTPEEIEDKSIMEIAAQIKESMDDEVLQKFFPHLSMGGSRPPLH